MSYNHEYQKPTVGSAGCTYSSLVGTYSCGNQGLGQGMFKSTDMNLYKVPILCPSNKQGKVPSYPPPYDTLQHGTTNGCGNKFSYANAYPFADCKTCNAPYGQRKCNGNIHAQCNPKPAPAPPVKDSFKFW